MHLVGDVMRDQDEQNPKKPRPLAVPKKGMSSLEALEATPWRPLKDADRDRHRHV
jgi:hypothetical protein